MTAEVATIAVGLAECTRCGKPSHRVYDAARRAATGERTSTVRRSA